MDVAKAMKIVIIFFLTLNFSSLQYKLMLNNEKYAQFWLIAGKQVAFYYCYFQSKIVTSSAQ